MADIALIYDPVAGKLKGGLVGADQLANAAVTSAKLGSGQIGSLHIAPGAIVSALIASGHVGSLHIAPNAIVSGRIATGAILSGNIVSGQVGVSHIVSFDPLRAAMINYVIDGGGSEIKSGAQGHLIVPFGGTIQEVTLLGDQSGAIRVDIWKDTYCVDTDTECLTKRGWTTWENLQQNDEILAYSPVLGMTQWETVRGKFVSDERSGFLYKIGKRLGAIVTPQHRWPAEMPHGRNRYYSFETYDTANLPHHARLLRSALHAAPTTPIYSDTFVELAAWYFTEGNLRPSSKAVIISQQVGDKATRIRTLLQRLESNRQAPKRIGSRGLVRKNGFHWIERRRGNIIHFNITGTDVDALTQAISDKAKVPTPQFLISLTDSQLQLFVDTCIAGDGYQKQAGRRYFSQHDKKRMDAFMMAAVLAGWSPSLDKKGTTCSFEMNGARGAARTYINGLDIIHIPYHGGVWCPQTISGFWLARRKGKVFITGNSNFPPTSVDTIASGLKPLISGGFKYQDATLTNWLTSLTSGDILAYHVDLVSTLTRVTVGLRVLK